PSWVILERYSILSKESLPTIPDSSWGLFPSIAKRQLNAAALTHEYIFNAQVAFAPSQMIPVRLATIVLTTLSMCSTSPPSRYTIAQPAPIAAVNAPHNAD